MYSSSFEKFYVIISCCEASYSAVRHETSRARFMESVSTTQKFCLLRYDPFGFNRENFANISQIKRN